MAIAGTEIERLIVRLVGDSSKYEKMLKTAQEQTKKSMTRIKQMASQIDVVGKKMTSMGRTLTRRVTLPVMAMGAAAVKAFASFDKAMVESTSIMKVTSEQTERMREQAKRLATQGVQGPEELAKSYYFLASAGLNAEQAIGALPIVQKFATAGAFDMAKATDLLTDAQSALGLVTKDTANNTKNMTRLGNLLVKANTMANASVEQFSTALTTKAGAAMKTYNIELEDGISLLAAYADQGIKAELAGNAMDRMYRLLIKSVADNAEAFERLNVKVFEGGELRKAHQIIRDLENALKDMTTEQKAAALTTLGFEARVQSVILPLIGASDAIEEYYDNAKATGDIMDEVAQKQLKSFSNQMKILWNQIKVAGIEIGNALVPTLKKLAEQFAKLVEWFRELNPGQKEFYAKMAVAVGLIGPVVVALGQLALAYKAVAAAAGTAAIATKGAGVGLSAAMGGAGKAAVAGAAGVAIGSAFVTKEAPKYEDIEGSFTGLKELRQHNEREALKARESAARHKAQGERDLARWGIVEGSGLAAGSMMSRAAVTAQKRLNRAQAAAAATGPPVRREPGTVQVGRWLEAAGKATGGLQGNRNILAALKGGAQGGYGAGQALGGLSNMLGKAIAPAVSKAVATGKELARTKVADDSFAGAMEAVNLEQKRQEQLRHGGVAARAAVGRGTAEAASRVAAFRMGGDKKPEEQRAQMIEILGEIRDSSTDQAGAVIAADFRTGTK